jgi:hypothetical protein
MIGSFDLDFYVVHGQHVILLGVAVLLDVVVLQASLLLAARRSPAVHTL